MSKFFGPGYSLSTGDSYFMGVASGPPPFQPTIVVPSANPTPNTTLLGVAGQLRRRKYSGYYADDLSFFSTHSPIETNYGRPEINASVEDNYSVMWTGYIYSATFGDYVLETTSDDASMVWVGDKAISGWNTGNADVNNGGLHGRIAKDTMPNVLRMQAGWYPIRIIFGEKDGGEFMAMRMYKYGSSSNEYLSFSYNPDTAEGYVP